MSGSIKVTDIAWLAGIIEGEGSFISQNSYPTITVSMTDEDVINKVSRLFSRPYFSSDKNVKYGGKIQYRVNICGTPAISWMFTLYSMMGYRRKHKIKEVIDQWKTLKVKDKANFPCGHSRSVSNSINRRRTNECKTCANKKSLEYYHRSKISAKETRRS